MSRAVTVTTSATPLDTVDDTADGLRGQDFIMYNNSAVTVYLGGSDVTTANGLPIAAGSWSPGYTLSMADTRYGIVASGTADVRVDETGV